MFFIPWPRQSDVPTIEGVTRRDGFCGNLRAATAEVVGKRRRIAPVGIGSSSDGEELNAGKLD